MHACLLPCGPPQDWGLRARKKGIHCPGNRGLVRSDSCWQDGTCPFQCRDERAYPVRLCRTARKLQRAKGIPSSCVQRTQSVHRGGGGGSPGRAPYEGLLACSRRATPLIKGEWRLARVQAGVHSKGLCALLCFPGASALRMSCKLFASSHRQRRWPADINRLPCRRPTLQTWPPGLQVAGWEEGEEKGRGIWYAL